MCTMYSGMTYCGERANASRIALVLPPLEVLLDDDDDTVEDDDDA